MAKNPSPSLLDAGQIIKRAFDDDNDSIRVDATITASSTSILIDATSDSIKVGNTATGPFLNVNNDGSINATVTASSLPLPSGSATSANQTSELTKLDTLHADLIAVFAVQLDDYSTTNVTYIGKAAVGSATSSAVWSIRKMDQTTGLAITWSGSGAYNQIWDNRTSLTYG